MAALQAVLLAAAAAGAAAAAAAAPPALLGTEAQSGAPAEQQHEAHSHETVHVVFSSHFDVGFTDMDSSVLDTWIHDHLPAAMRLAEELRQGGTEDRFVFMAHSWVISLALDCPPDIGIRCPSAAEVEDLEAAIHQGVITWHAMPNIAQLELMDEGLLRAAVRLTHALDARFGLPPKQTMNQRDVPGFTRSAIPVLHGEGVRAVTVGVNGVTAPPAVPHDAPFWYRDEASGTQLLSFWHAGGYTGNPVDNAQQCIHAPGFDRRLCLSWTNDNSGPPSMERLQEVLALVRGQFPGARVVCSGLDEFVTRLLEAAPRLDLPVVTSEIGDTWIYGVASDPRKVAEYRQLLRWRQAALPRYGAAALARFDQLLLKLPEHTWSVSVQHLGGDIGVFDNGELHARASDAGARAEAEGALAALAAGNRPPRVTAGLERADLAAPLRFATTSRHGWEVELDPQTGAIIGLWPPRQRRRGGRAAPFQRPWAREERGGSLASPAFPLGLVMYSTISGEDYKAYYDDYHYVPNKGWFEADFAKYALPDSAAHSETTPTLTAVWSGHTADGGLHIVTKGHFPDELVRQAGAPQAVWTEIVAPAGGSELHVSVVWENKTATRLPEATWVRWMPDPAAVDASTWQIRKLGRPVSPLDVVLNGSHSLHAVGDEGVAVQTTGGARLRISSPDAGLLSPGRPTPFPVLEGPRDLTGGMAWCLHNNIWGTNYPMWYPFSPGDATMRFRFVLTLEPPADKPLLPPWLSRSSPPVRAAGLLLLAFLAWPLVARPGRGLAKRARPGLVVMVPSRAGRRRPQSGGSSPVSKCSPVSKREYV